MKNDFKDLLKPDLNTYYYYAKNLRAKNWTHLMKLILMVKKFPHCFCLIKTIVTKYPEEINKKNSHGITPLMIAAINCKKYSNIECVELLINSGANINDIDHNGRTSLIWASRWSNNYSCIECVKLLIDSGANIYHDDDDGFSSLTHACRWADTDSSIECVKLLIKRGAHINNKNWKKKTIIYIAAMNVNTGSSTECVKLLIDNDANLNTAISPLVDACKYANTTSSIECVKILLDGGANINHENNDYFTALYNASVYANTTSSIECVKLLLDNGADADSYRSPLVDACKYANTTSSIECVKLLIDCDADVNHINSDKNNSFYNACKYADTTSSMECVELLLNCGVNINYALFDDDGGYWYNSLSYVINNFDKKNSIKFIRLLLENGIEINDYINGETLLMHIYNLDIETDYTIEILQMLIDYGIDINNESEEEETFLDFLISHEYSNRNLECVKFILSKGANINPLIIHRCCSFIDRQVDVDSENFNAYIRLFLEYGVCINNVDSNGNSVLMYACANSYGDKSSEIIRLLINSGANVNVKNNEGWTSLMFLFRVKKRFTHMYSDTIMMLIHNSRLTICDKNIENKTAYDLYIEKKFDILSPDQLEYLKGSKIYGPKSSRNLALQ